MFKFCHSFCSINCFSFAAIQMGRIRVDERAERLIEFKDLQQRSEVHYLETPIVGEHLGLFIIQCFVLAVYLF